ncbi:MAG: PRK06851 family protein [bacterium]|jgi:hypothetical protein
MSQGYVKKVFPGSNTSQGFYSFWDYVVSPEARRILIMKGGPGVGKSTFMRKIVQEVIERGFDVELYCCAADVNSLDGFGIPQLGIVLLDGTAPHLIDPKYPGAVEEIINLGEYWDVEQIKAHKQEIIQLVARSKQFYKRAYRFLQAAQLIYRDWEDINMKAMNFAYANQQAVCIINEIFPKEPGASTVGRQRHLFARAVTPAGILNYVDTIIRPCQRRYVIEGEPGTGKSTLIQKVATAAVERGYNVELFHCPLNPEKVEHIVIDELGVALTKSIEPHRYDCLQREDTLIDLNLGLDRQIIVRNAHLIKETAEMFTVLFNKGTEYIGQAKKQHDYLEKLYAPTMDFAAIGRLRDKILAEILAYAKELQS